MSFVKNIFGKGRGGGTTGVETREELDDDEELSETSTDSEDTGVYSPDSFSPANSNSDMEATLDVRRLNTATALTESGISVSGAEECQFEAGMEADCSTISNFFGYWYVLNVYRIYIWQRTYDWIRLTDKAMVHLIAVFILES
ncbi:hypothetical protein GWI33_010668 [Rhynchophorus ferrugineus]|uniref:Uncharacterized protein n=1 Tax=Rhynchophorus ferrugineus TaxID=354439 RepID=A0A834MNB5_RHYFE|nr:hypothetical protein GWI33_010668 [Rhynchophorus ferrugineus]